MWALEAASKLKLGGGNPFMFSNSSLSSNKLVAKYVSLGRLVERFEDRENKLNF